MNKKTITQSTLFDYLSEDIYDKNQRINNISPFNISNFERFKFYSIYDYQNDVLKFGLRMTWKNICEYALQNHNSNKFLNYTNFAELYEIGLAISDKEQKKYNGQYYTPDDVAMVMANWFDKQKGINICDVACGTGKLIITFLDLIGEKKAIEVIKKGQLFLYDLDDTALSICKTILLLKYGKELEPFIHAIHCDFLSTKTTLPCNCKVISNPPYAVIKKISNDWDKTVVSLETKEIYSIFMEKIIKQSESSVIITPYSFVGGKKFYSLRTAMNNYNGFIVSFDNVPGNIFCGRKHGIFNSNTSNSVRAAITVVENKDNFKGFKTTPLIRFKNEERKSLLKTDKLESFLNDKYQIVTKKNPMYYKCTKELKSIWESWQEQSNKHLEDYICRDGQYILSIPNTCRYFTIASKGLMKRNGQIVLNIKDEDTFNYIYCLINSSFAYWYWRLFDGGITYPKSLLLNIPVFYNKLTAEDKTFFRNVASEMIANSHKYIITKNNVGVQENIKFPRKYRDMINRKMLDILGINVDEKIFDYIHSNMALEVNV